MTKFVNLTPHDLTIRVNGKDIVIPKSGTVARVSVNQDVVGDIDGIPLVANRYGDVVELPDPQPDTVYIVSSMVLAAVKDRSDVVAPDTGPTAIRDDSGRIVAVTRLVINS